MQRAQIIAHTAALSHGQNRIDPLDIARSVIVLGCALALIMAGPVLPV
jgi:hypothetical protein